MHKDDLRTMQQTTGFFVKGFSNMPRSRYKIVGVTKLEKDRFDIELLNNNATTCNAAGGYLEFSTREGVPIQFEDLFEYMGKRMSARGIVE